MSTTETETNTKTMAATTSAAAPRPVRASEAEQKLLPTATQHVPNGQLPNTPLAVSVISALLGGLLFSSLAYLSVPYLIALGAGEWVWVRPQLALYGMAMAVFHLSEFWTTAGWNPKKLSIDAFLLNNGIGYHAAHFGGLLEYFLSNHFQPRRFDGLVGSKTWLGAVLVVLIIGQTFRSLAMIHAARSFSHIVKAVKHDDHVLVTSGVYAWFRHPSYFGFFYWAIATQLLLGNYASPFAFALVLGRFFYARIIGEVDEERYLVRFFGDEYVQFRKRVGTGLPFPTT